MDCNRAQRLLTTPPERHSRWRPIWTTPYFWAIIHATNCAECGAFNLRNIALNDQIARWKSDTARDLPEGFQTRVAHAVGDALRDRAASPLLDTLPLEKRKRIMSPLFLIAATAAIVGAIVAPLVKMARRQTPQTLPAVRFISAAKEPPVYNAHVTTWTPDAKGTLRVEEEMWYERSCWRKEGVYGTRIIRGGEDYPRNDPSLGKRVYGIYFRYDSRKNRLVHMPEVGEQPTRFTTDTLISASALAGATVISQEIRDGKIIREYEIAGDATSRTRLWADVVNNLPVRYESAVRSSEASAVWVTTFRQDFVFNQPLPAALFDPTKLIDEGRLKDEGWKR